MISKREVWIDYIKIFACLYTLFAASCRVMLMKLG